jgi:hypothetical protein
MERTMTHAELTARLERLANSIRRNFAAYMHLANFPERRMGARIRNRVCKRQHARLVRMLPPMTQAESFRLLVRLTRDA